MDMQHDYNCITRNLSEIIYGNDRKAKGKEIFTPSLYKSLP